MRTILLGLMAALVLLACGGGNDAGLPAEPASLAQSAIARASGGAGPGLIAEQPVLVNSVTAGQQVLKTLGAIQDGGYTVAWVSGVALYLQRYDSAGIRAAGETQVPLVIQAINQQQALDSRQVAVLQDGSVVVAYLATRVVALPDGSSSVNVAAYLQRFDAGGTLVTGETRVSPLIALVGPRSTFIGELRIAALTDGGFVVGWATANFSARFGAISTLWLQRYDSQGRPAGSAISLGQFPALGFSLIADAAAGHSVVARFVDAAFNPLVSVVHFNADQTATPILSGSPGAFALLLPLADRYLLFVSGPAGAYQQVLDAQGNPVGDKTPITSMPVAAAQLADATYVLVWPDSGDFVVRRFDMAGTPIGRSFPVRTGGAAPQLVALAQGGFALSWSGPGAAGDTDVFVQRFPEATDARRNACLDRAKGLKGQERKAFLQSCMT